MCDLGEATFHIDNRANEVDGDLVTTAAAHDVVPQLAAFLLGPRVGALVDGDHELGRLFEKIEEFGFGGFHNELPNVLRRGIAVIAFSTHRV